MCKLTYFDHSSEYMSNKVKSELIHDKNESFSCSKMLVHNFTHIWTKHPFIVVGARGLGYIVLLGHLDGL